MYHHFGSNPEKVTENTTLASLTLPHIVYSIQFEIEMSTERPYFCTRTLRQIGCTFGTGNPPSA